MLPSALPAALAGFHPAVGTWFARTFAAPTAAQSQAWPALQRGESTLLLAPTGSGKTLAAFLHAIDRLMFAPVPATPHCRVLYVSPLKALAVDVERNLRAPLTGIGHVALDRGDVFHTPSIALRTGDTPARERARLLRAPADILITTPESLYLLLTSQAREGLRHVETVIVDEIHALVPTKRGAHLALSLERLEALGGRPLQRVGLSATQNPLAEVARFLGGLAGPAEPAPAPAAEDPLAFGDTTAKTAPYRPVTVVDAGLKKALALRVEVPVEDMREIGRVIDIPSGPAAQGPVRASIWSAMHPRLLELVKAHRSTLIFVNSRRIAERLAAALNELAAETLVYAHHGSLALTQRAEIEDRLKLGQVRALVATSSLELGIDMGAVDLVVQIEAPPSVASGLQRIGRGGHQVGATSQGVLFPKYRADLLACAALTRAMNEGEVEPVAYPRNALDVLAQQLVAMVAMEPWTAEALYATVCRAAPYAHLPRAAFENLLDMLTGRYASDDFAELRPRLTWDRAAGTLTARESARRVAVTSGGTIPDRGLFGVYLAGGSERGHARIGELDEEMVFESRPGETFVLGASTWRMEEITHDRVLVSPAPGEAGKMPFWRGDAAGRSVQLGRKVGALVRELRGLSAASGRALLVKRHGLDEAAAQNLLAFLSDQAAATRVVPDERTLVVERVRDELGDYRVCVLSPLGGRVHAPWAMAVAARVRAETGAEVETMWTDDGLVVRFPDTEHPPDIRLLLPEPEELEDLLMQQLGGTAVFAARFREAASRALLLPRRHPGRRAPLWQTRKRAADLLAVAAKAGSFPMLLEAYRECLRDTFDLPALLEVLRGIKGGQIAVHTVDADVPSPFAGTLLFGFVANYIYDGDAPLPERRAQALSIDQAQLRELLGDAELRDLLDPEALETLEAELVQPVPRERLRTADGLADLLLRLGELSRTEIERKMLPGSATAALTTLLRERRAVELFVAAEPRVVAIEHASRYRDALGLPLPPGLPESLLRPVADPLGDLLLRYARTHGPFTTAEPAARWGVPAATLTPTLRRLRDAQKLLEGAFRPGGRDREWCAPEVLSSLRRRSLAKLRKEVEPAAPAVLARTIAHWQGLRQKRGGLDAVMDAVEKLQGAPLPASLVETEIFPARVDNYLPGDLDALAAAGELVWVGLSPLGPRDGRVALYLTDALPRLHRAPTVDEEALSPRERAVLMHLRGAGASFFAAVAEAVGGFANETVEALWSLVWKGLVTNDTFGVLRTYTRPAGERSGRRVLRDGRSFQSRRLAPANAQGRWSLVEARTAHRARPNDTERAAALARQLLERHALLTRDALASEDLVGGFSAVYDTLKLMEEAGRIRRGYFVEGVAATQFAEPAALELLRALRTPPETPEVLCLAALDPANPYGSLLPWPESPNGAASGDPEAEGPNPRGLLRTVGAHVVLVDGQLGAYLARGHRQLRIWLPEDEPDRGRRARLVAEAIAHHARHGGPAGEGVLLTHIEGASARVHPFADALVQAGFVATAAGLQMRRGPRDKGVAPRRA